MAPSAGSVGREAAAAARGSTMHRVAAVGLVALGVVHLVVGGLALRIAWGGGADQEASPTGAFATLAEQPLGVTLLWVCAAGLAGLAIWQAADAIWGHTGRDGLEHVGKRLSAGGKAVAYAVLAFVAARTATSGPSSGGQDAEESITSRLMGAPAGVLLVGLVGVGIVVVALYLVHRGLTERFTDDLVPRSSRAVVRVGQVGHVAKGVAYAVVGLLFLTAAVRHDPDASGGLDEALATLRDQPYGQWLLTAVALGLVAYGGYAFAWARAVHARS